MGVKRRVSRIVGLTADLVRSAETSSAECAPVPAAHPDRTARHLSHEYGARLRACLSRAEVKEIIREGRRKAWPHLNEEPVRLGSIEEFAQRASALGAEFRIARMSWASGLSLFGFYLGGDSALKRRPLICLNGAHHPAVVGTAFIHEVGHHVTAELFSARDKTAQLSRPTGYEAHLSDPRELAADLLVSIGVYPRELAARLFDAEPDGKIAASAEQRVEFPAAAGTVVGTALRYGLDLESLPVQKRLQYEAGLVYFTKLRQALLDEYGF